jgi:phosphate transport system substrate-binding protein
MRTLKILTWVVASLVLIASPLAQADPVTINGAGATFPYPLYSKWFSEFHQRDAGVEINYQSIGSGGGIRQLLDRTIDFGGSDAPMTDEQLAKSSVPILHIPTAMGAVTLTYNLPGFTGTLRLSGPVIADMYLGKITKWDDPAIVALNPGAALPKDLSILVGYRSDGSGTTAVFSDYLSKVSGEWKQKVGQGTSLQWPTGLGGKGNEGVTGLIKQTPGALGYVELAYASSNGLPFAQLKNKAGSYVTPSPKTVTAAAEAASRSMPKDFRTSITDSDGKESYPISSFTYLLVYQSMPGAKGVEFVKFLNWAMVEGQKMAEPLTYAPLPQALTALVKAKIKEIKTN